MDDAWAFILGLAIVVSSLLTWAVTEGGWTADCSKLNTHLAYGGKVYKCSPQ